MKKVILLEIAIYGMMKYRKKQPKRSNRTKKEQKTKPKKLVRVLPQVQRQKLLMEE